MATFSAALWAANVEVEIKGANRQQRANINAHLGTLPETPQHRASFVFNAEAAATKALAAIGYYQPEIEVTIDRQKDPWQLLLAIDPGPATEWETVRVDISGDAAELPAFAQIADDSDLIAGRRLQHGQYDNAKATLLRQAQRFGFFDGELTVARLEVDRQRHRANAILVYDSGPRYQFGEVSFQGSELKPELLQSMLPFAVGTPYDLNLISRLNGSLVQSGYFASVRVLPMIDQRRNGQVPVRVELSPARTHAVGLGVGFATDTRERASITWRTPAINRYGHSQETKLELSKVNPYARFTYDIPLGDPNVDLLRLQLGLEENDYADITSEMRHARVGRRTQVGRWILQYYLRYLHEEWEILADDFTGRYVLPGVTLAQTRRRGNVTDPEAGFRQLYLLELASEDLYSEANIVRAVARLTWVARLSEKHRWVLRAHLGASHFQDRNLDDVPPSLRFYAGGDESVRGFDYQSLGPKLDYTDDEGNQRKLTVGGRYLAVGSIEHQYYLNESWRIALFTDFGNAYESLDDSFDPEYSLGTGIHWLTAVGPLKLEFARSISEDNPSWRLHINIGAEL